MSRRSWTLAKGAWSSQTGKLALAQSWRRMGTDATMALQRGKPLTVATLVQRWGNVMLAWLQRNPKYWQPCRPRAWTIWAMTAVVPSSICSGTSTHHPEGVLSVWVLCSFYLCFSFPILLSEEVLFSWCGHLSAPCQWQWCGCLATFICLFRLPLIHYFFFFCLFGPPTTSYGVHPASVDRRPLLITPQSFAPRWLWNRLSYAVEKVFFAQLFGRCRL